MVEHLLCRIGRRPSRSFSVREWTTFPIADDQGLCLVRSGKMGLSAPRYAPIAGLERQRAANVRCDDWRRSLPTTLALVVFLAGCADLGQPKLSFRQPSLRVADAALAAGAPEV